MNGSPRQRQPAKLIQPATKWVGCGAVVLLQAQLVSGCAADSEVILPNDRTWESEHFRYHLRNNDVTCPEVLARLESHFAQMQDFLGFSWPENRKVDYYKFEDTADYERNSDCPSGTDGCTTGSTIRTSYTILEHELIHAYLAPMGLPPALFVEGMASVLACRNPTATLTNPIAWQQAVMLPSTDRNHAYIEGAWFMGYLIHRYGTSKVLSLYARLAHGGSDLRDIESTFESVYDADIGAVWSEGLVSSHQFRCVNIWQCSSPPLRLDGTVSTFAQACDGSDNARSFEVARDTDFLFSVEGPSVYAPVPCDEELPLALSGAEFQDLTESTVVRVPSGKYFLQAVGNHWATVAASSLPSQVLSQDCSEVHTLELRLEDFPRYAFSLTIPRDGEHWYVKVNRNIVWTDENVVPVEVEECSSCDEAAVCTPLSGDAHPDANGNVTLRLRSTAEGSGYVTTTFLF